MDQARAQPSYVGGRLFVASENGEVHALDPETGCTLWSYTAMSGVRTAVMVGAYEAADGTSGFAAYFGDTSANAYAVDANTGALIWSREIDDHASAAITGPLTVHDGRVYVPTQGLNEEGSGVRNGYPCCTFRGRFAALDANTGEVIWNSYTVDEPKLRGRNDAGVDAYGPAGGGIWSPATVDPPPEVAERIRREQARVAAARTEDRPLTGFAQHFTWPVEGRISGRFGRARVYNGKPGSPHSGMDIATPRGTPIKAPAAGVVTLADPDLYITGGTVLIDHGHGIGSNFLHMSRLDVEAGDSVEQGQVIGAVGATGRATGPHLHWGMTWFTTRIDPQLVLERP